VLLGTLPRDGVGRHAVPPAAWLQPHRGAVRERRSVLLGRVHGRGSRDAVCAEHVPQDRRALHEGRRVLRSPARRLPCRRGRRAPVHGRAWRCLLGHGRGVRRARTVLLGVLSAGWGRRLHLWCGLRARRRSLRIERRLLREVLCRPFGGKGVRGRRHQHAWVCRARCAVHARPIPLLRGRRLRANHGRNVGMRRGHQVSGPSDLS
jgi:hypothetical protein